MFLGAMKKKKENWEVIISYDSDDELWLFSFLLVEKSLLVFFRVGTSFSIVYQKLCVLISACVGGNVW